MTLQKSELEIIKTIIGYAHSLFAHDGDSGLSASDPLTILKEAQAGRSFSCNEYSMLANGLLWAHGLAARTIGLKTMDVETRKYGAGHAVIEFWSSDSREWVMCDVQAGVIPRSGQNLLSAVELAQVISQNDKTIYMSVAGSKFNPESRYSGKPNYAEWIKEYLYFIDTPIHLTLSVENPGAQQIVMLVPLGSANPKMFQGIFEMNAVYTRSV